MKILIITTYYPPDTAIAAVRPYMFAKYLQKMGHEVTVLRSGEIRDGFSSCYVNDPAVRVISFLGEASPAERYERGEPVEGASLEGRSRLHFLPEAIRKPIAKAYHTLTRANDFGKGMQTIDDKVQKQKLVLDSLRQEQFDVVFSTYGQLENIRAGQYAAELFGCPLIQDFRDTLANREFQNRREYTVLKRIQDEAAQKADVCTAVSEGVLREVCSGLAVAQAQVLYNGYEPAGEEAPVSGTEEGVLSFCYTGQLYGGIRDFSPLLKALHKLNEDGRVRLDKIRIHYAGKDFAYLQNQAEKHGVTECLVDHGYVGREEAAAMQSGSDLFVVLSWNTKKTQGVLTGKFYEGIRARKPILAMLAGEVPYSELHLIQEKYHYGFCYESSREKEQFQQLCDWLEKAYTEKMTAGSVAYTPDPALETDFRYDALAKRLDALCRQLTDSSKKE